VPIHGPKNTGQTEQFRPIKEDFLRSSQPKRPAENAGLPRFEDSMLGSSQVAKMLAMSPRTVCYLASLGDLPGIKIGRAWRFWRSDILEYLETHRGENLLGQDA
jgi:excisionase family DNA binding protein